MNLAIALTAIRHKACITNHTELVDLIKEKVAGTGESRITGAVVRDLETGKSMVILDEELQSKWCCIVAKRAFLPRS